MKKQLLKTSYILFFVSVVQMNNAFAQMDETAAFLNAGRETASNLAGAYLGPVIKGFGMGLNDGWNNNTARTLGLGGFDLRINLGIAQIPSSDQTYNLNNVFTSSVSSIKFVPDAGTSNTQSSFFGPKNDNPGNVLVKGSIPNPLNPSQNIDTTIAKIPLPKGIGVPMTLASPSIQLSVGLVKNTELMIRYAPSINIPYVGIGVGTFGLGVKHSIKQWIPAIKETPLWDWSAFATYSNFHAEYDFGSNGLQPDPSSINTYSPDYFNNQKLIMSGYGISIGTIASIKLLFFTPYIGINYAYSNYSLQFTGNYPVPSPNTDPTTIQQGKLSKIASVTDPISIPGSIPNMRLNAGFRLKFALFVFGAEYSLGTYNTATMSIGVNLQSILPPSI
ncbi:MAG: DUF6588 family protein [Bacteroidia bacterium]